LAKVLALPFLNLDALAHRPHWQDTPLEDFRNQVSEFIEANPEGWIIDGNYQRMVGDITWHSATDIIWLDYPIFVVLWRLWFRTIARIRSAERLWGMDGCIETWQHQFFSWDSLLFAAYLLRLTVVCGCFGFIGTGVQSFIRIYLESTRES
jgi:hypothetical protein